MYCSECCIIWSTVCRAVLLCSVYSLITVSKRVVNIRTWTFHSQVHDPSVWPNLSSIVFVHGALPNCYIMMALRFDHTSPFYSFQVFVRALSTQLPSKPELRTLFPSFHYIDILSYSENSQSDEQECSSISSQHRRSTLLKSPNNHHLLSRRIDTSAN